MKDRCAVSVVIPAYQSGAALWLGLAQLVGWRHHRIGSLQVVVIDDGSPDCAFGNGSLTIADTELLFLVNPRNIGQSRTCLRGIESSTGELVVFLEDDLRDWSGVLSHLVSGFTEDTDLVNLDRGDAPRAATTLRRAAQPLVRAVFRFASGHRLQDPTSPLKAVRRSRFETAALNEWAEWLAEGLVLCARNPVEVAAPGLRWDERPSRYTVAKVAGMVLGFLPPLLFTMLRRRSR
jgi:hypothetical protein